MPAVLCNSIKPIDVHIPKKFFVENQMHKWFSIENKLSLQQHRTNANSIYLKAFLIRTICNVYKKEKSTITVCVFVYGDKAYENLV